MKKTYVDSDGLTRRYSQQDLTVFERRKREFIARLIFWGIIIGLIFLLTFFNPFEVRLN
jgi:hypothetical protein